jgi:hypothetical protein
MVVHGHSADEERLRGLRISHLLSDGVDALGHDATTLGKRSKKLVEVLAG